MQSMPLKMTTMSGLAEASTLIAAHKRSAQNQARRLFGNGVKFENAPHFLYRLRVLMRAVTRRHDEFALCAVHVGTPIWHDAVGHHRPGVVAVATFAAVTADHVVRDPGREPNGLDRTYEAIVGRESIDTVRNAFETQIVALESGQLHHFGARA